MNKEEKRKDKRKKYSVIMMEQAWSRMHITKDHCAEAELHKYQIRGTTHWETSRRYLAN